MYRADAPGRAVEEMAAYDLYDVLADLGYGLAPRTRAERAEAFRYKHTAWLAGLPGDMTATLEALVGQFARSGTESLANSRVFQVPAVTRAGGLAALGLLGAPAAVLRETKERIFSA